MEKWVRLTRIFGLQSCESIFKLSDSVAQFSNLAMKVFGGSQNKTVERSNSPPGLQMKGNNTEFLGLLINSLENIEYFCRQGLLATHHLDTK